MRHVENKKWNSSYKFNHLSNNIRWEHIQQSNWKAERIRLSEKQDPPICWCKRCFWFKDTNRLKVKGYRKTRLANSNNKRSRLAVLISGSIYLKAKNVTGGKARNFVIIKESIHQDTHNFVMNIDTTELQRRGIKNWQNWREKLAVQ